MELILVDALEAPYPSREGANRFSWVSPAVAFLSERASGNEGDETTLSLSFRSLSIPNYELP